MERELVGSRPLTVEDKQAILITLIGIKLDTEILNNLLCSTMCNYKTKQIPLNHLTSYSNYFHYVSKHVILWPALPEGFPAMLSTLFASFTMIRFSAVVRGCHNKSTDEALGFNVAVSINNVHNLYCY